MKPWGLFWQFSSSNIGLLSLSKLENQLNFPKTILKISEKINCKSWSLNITDARNIVDRILAAQHTLQQFTTQPGKIKNIYFFKRRRARSIFKKRLNNYISFEIVANVPWHYWFSFIVFASCITPTISTGFNLPVGFFIKGGRSLLQFKLINSGILIAFLRNEPITVRPHILVGHCKSNPSSLLKPQWFINKLNEATQV